MPFKGHVHMITADNGREFAYHAEIAEALNTRVYFAHPYSSWERGANENSNGLLRQYVPKGTDLRDVTEENTLRDETNKLSSEKVSRVQATSDGF
jgi:IS30 family transposase